MILNSIKKIAGLLSRQDIYEYEIDYVHILKLAIICDTNYTLTMHRLHYIMCLRIFQFYLILL